MVHDARADGLVISSFSTSSSRTSGAAGLTVSPAAAQTSTAAISSSTTYTYTLALEAYSSLYKPTAGPGANSPDFIEIFDFAGLQGALTFTPGAGSGLTAGDFLLSSPSLSPLPAALGVGNYDNAHLLNLKADFNRDRPLINNSAHTLILGTLSAVSQFGTTVNGRYVSTDTDAAGNTGSTLGAITVPLAEPLAVAPLPGVAWTSLPLLGFVGLARFSRRRKTLAVAGV